MLKVIEGDSIYFYCPVCKSEEIVYITMPTTCYFCGRTHGFDIYDLLKGRESTDHRVAYHYGKAVVYGEN